MDEQVSAQRARLEDDAEALVSAVAAEKETRERIQAALDLAVTSVGHEWLYASALATNLSCDRVSLGFVMRGRSHRRCVAQRRIQTTDQRDLRIGRGDGGGHRAARAGRSASASKCRIPNTHCRSGLSAR